MENNRNIYNGSYNGRQKNTEGFAIRLTEPFLYDRLHILAAEYSVPVELLADAAVKRLLEDVDFVRDLRAGRAKGE